MKPAVTIISIADIKLRQAGIGREGSMAVKPLPLQTGVPGVEMEFSWVSYDKGYGTPRHKHIFDQFRFSLSGEREIKDGYLKAGDCGFYPEGVSYGPQMQSAPTTGLNLQFQGAAGLPYLRHLDLQRAQRELEADGGVFEHGVYTFVRPDGKKIAKDGHQACAEHLTGRKLDFPKPRFEMPIVMHAENAQWVIDRKLPGIEHKHLGTFGVRRSGARLLRVEAGAVIPAHVEEDAQIRYLIEGAIEYDGKTWQGGKTQDAGTYMFVQAGAHVGEIRSSGGGTFFVIDLPLIADIAVERARETSREPQLV